ncbi:MAG: ParB/RepB/Spo0J family partition protein [Bryobacteraceae bacterium]|jgi:ParB-like chromosome segregation protein Spo0J
MDTPKTTTHDLAIGEVACDSVRVAGRHRKDMGDLDGLAVSIATEGLLQPIGITEDNVLVFGERRLLAVRDILRRATITARVVRVSSIVAGEYAENEIRKNFTPSERVAIGKALEVEIGDRQGRRTGRELPQNFAEVEPGVETRELAAKTAGFGNRTTYEQAKKVVEKAVDEVIAQMDSEQIAVSAAALIADEAPERQREIVALPPAEQREAVRTLRRKDLPSAAEAHQRAKETGMFILDPNLQWQTPMPMEQRRPLIERNHAVMAVVEAARAMATCPLTAAEVAAGIREFDTPDMDFAGQCRKAAALLQQITQELDGHAGQ